ncbi:MAG: hypothetical protein EXS22_01090 [Pedosphaera sp.]|nr:hypothetical protein [Pedosphaera sp.]MSU42620.1 hypothetical protein [Pedosphaera sp.]
MNEWNIQTRAHACAACARPFADKEPCHTLLLDEAHAYQRQDLCSACWLAQHPENAPGPRAFMSHWKGVHSVPPPVTDIIQKDTAESLLRKLVATRDVRWREASYILAVMLERKRILKVKEQLREEGQRVFVYEQPSTGDLFTIPDPQLRLEALQQVQADVAALLEYGLPVAGQPWPPTAVAMGVAVVVAAAVREPADVLS